MTILTALLGFAFLQSPADPLSEQAIAAAQSGDLSNAARLWTEAIAKDPKHFPSLFNLGLMFHRQKRQAEAAPLLDRAAAIQPGYQVHLIRGQNFQQLERREDAIRAWRAALTFQPKNVKLMQVLSVEYTRGRYFHEAAAIARQAIAITPDDVNLYFLAIKAFQDAGDHNAAAALAAQASTRFPQSGRAQFEHGYYLQKKGDTGAALPFLKKAMALDPGYEEPFFFYGDLLVKQGRFEEALDPLRKALALRPEYSPARVALARALSRIDKLPDAIAELEQAALLDPRNAQPWVLLAQLYFKQGNEEKARHARETSLRLRRENPEVLEAAQARPFPAK